MKNNLNQKYAQLIGMHSGDGTLYKTGWGLVWEIRGGLDEKEYYFKSVCPLLKSIFNEEFIPKYRSGGKNGCFGVQTSNKKVTSFFLNWKFKPGTKTYTVRIPNYIKKSNKLIKLAFIRGLFDTDRCLRFEKKPKNYPKIEFGFASKNLRDDLSKMLTELNYRNYSWEDKNISKLCVYGRKTIAKWMNEIKPQNPKHLNKWHLSVNKLTSRSHNSVLRRHSLVTEIMA